MSAPVFRQVGEPRADGIVAVCDHAANYVPDDIDLGIAPELLSAHIAWDIGTAGVAERMAGRHDIPAYLARVGRLVVDLNREEDAPGVIPVASDGHAIPGNIGVDRAARIAAFHRPYHDRLAQWLDAARPSLILAVHSFTPRLQNPPDGALRAEDRPWQVGLLYNRDARAARHAIRLFGERGFVVGDNQPYSGRVLNATMNRHAEAHGRPYLSIELRNDLVADAAGQERWAKVLAEVAREVVALMAREETFEKRPARSGLHSCATPAKGGSQSGDTTK